MNALQLGKERAKKLRAQQDEMRRQAGDLPAQATETPENTPAEPEHPPARQPAFAGAPVDRAKLAEQQAAARKKFEGKKPKKPQTAFEIYTAQQQRQARMRAGDIVKKQNAGYRAE